MSGFEAVQVLLNETLCMIAIQININLKYRFWEWKGIAIFTDFLGVESMDTILCFPFMELFCEQKKLPNHMFPWDFLPLIPLVSFLCLFVTA